MSLLNYTTGISVDKTVSEIQRVLTKNGASAILVENDDNGEIIALSFRVKLNDQVIAFRLPSDWRPVLKILENDQKVPRAKRTKEQALRVSWRIIKDWVEAQMAIVQTKMVTVDQVFLPYAVSHDGRTLYETVKSSNLLSAPQA
jgi:ubiquinone/menaquinone biosynthesis C-methylase UbiE